MERYSTKLEQKGENEQRLAKQYIQNGSFMCLSHEGTFFLICSFFRISCGLGLSVPGAGPNVALRSAHLMCLHILTAPLLEGLKILTSINNCTDLSLLYT